MSNRLLLSSLDSSLACSSGTSLGTLTGSGGLGDDGLDDTDSNGLSHVTDGETTKRGVGSEGLNAHGLRGGELDDGGITVLDVLGGSLELSSSTTVDLGQELRELAGNVGGVAVEHWSVSSVDLSGVVQDDDLSVEGLSLLRGVVLGITSDHTTTDILDGQVLNVETDVVSWDSLREGDVVHLDGLDFSGQTGGGEGNVHSWLEDTSLNTTDGHQ